MLWTTPLLAQRTLTGRVTDSKDGTDLAGVTIIQKNTMNGVASSTDGSFQLTIPSSPDSVTLVFSSIGYVRIERRVPLNKPVDIALSQDTRQFECDLLIAYPRYELGLSSGVLHTPAGATLLYRPKLRNLATVVLSYQTNLGRNYQASAAVTSAEQYPGHTFQGNASVEHRRIRLADDGFHFVSTALTTNVSLQRFRYFTLVLGTGYAHQQTENTRAYGLGYTFGGQSFVPGVDILLRAQATRWPGYWQWQGSATHQMRRLRLSLLYNQVRQYREFNLGASYPIYRERP
ncbi:hypothetical protein B0919_22890 [Hymenobacter sp. CRA2]|nr:hypothetical protein B0919_22890 [Hymenobacter sp. CRA2]